MNILVFGAPGTGKSTTGRHIAERLGLPWLSTGAVLREVAREDEQVARLLASGELVPDADVDRVLFERLARYPAGFVLDGYPRTNRQAESLLRFLRERSRSIDRVYDLHVPDEVVMERLRSRGREDDSPDVVGERLRVYRSQTKPVLGMLEQAGAEIVDVDNARTSEEVKRQLDASLGGAFSGAGF